jgi:HEPN domain-containing protein
MKPPDARHRSTLAWLERAEEDLTLARLALGNPELTWGVCFHSQQAAEKALKGYLAWLGADPIPRSHNLFLLAATIADLGGAPPAAEHLRQLNAYSAGVRYPDTEEPPPEEAEPAVQQGSQIVALVRAAIQAPSREPQDE